MSNRWDEFTIGVAEQLPRRESLRRLGLAVAAAVLAPLGLEGAGRKILADPCKAFCKCSNKKQQNACLTACKACNNDPTRLSGSCGSYTCCGAGQSSCGGYCADLSDDFYNCGSCGNYCDSPDAYESGACIDGHCEYWCVDGADYCNGHCTPLNEDYENCGACGNVCTGSTPYCNNGVCSQCLPGMVACGTTCTNLSSDNANCGACGNTCGGSTPYCNNGTCGECPHGLTLCSGQCADLWFDNLNCGGCGVVCAGDMTCVAGVCQFLEPCWDCGF